MERIWINQQQHVVQAITFFAASRFGRSDSAFASDMDKIFLLDLFLFKNWNSIVRPCDARRAGRTVLRKI
jgi:hypothetical protein